MTTSTNTRRALGALISSAAVIGVVALFFEYKHHQPALHAPHLSVNARELPYYAWCSFYRMLAAYVAALIFSLIYGTAAARSRARERLMIPLIDIAQSVPVIGFFPAAIYFFVAMAPGRLGVELAAIFLIFTSMAWNMVLGVFESVRTIPIDSNEALDAFGANRWLKLKRLVLPACVPKLVYNSILSWVAGWYYLIACEIITAGPSEYRLPGLGSFLMTAAGKARWAELLLGLLLLLLIIILMDAIVWQPLSAWAEKFRYEFAASSEGPISSLGMFDVLGSIGPNLMIAGRRTVAPAFSLAHRMLSATPPFHPAAHPRLTRIGRILRVTIGIAFVVVIAYALIDGAIALVRALVQPWPAAAQQIPAATGASIVRLLIAYLISLAWTIPCAIAASENSRFAQRLSSFAQIAGSMPATALFPLIVVFVIRVTGANLASILLILTGMQWYLLFNLLAGVSQIPADLKEAARSFGLSRVATWRKLTLPALAPSLLTGSITAWGGGWNALILSEYFVFRGVTYKVFGLGAMLDVATYQTGSNLMILLTLLSMVLVVVFLNRFFWRKMYDLATERYRIDY